jgi:hypothetical protein
LVLLYKVKVEVYKNCKNHKTGRFNDEPLFGNIRQLYECPPKRHCPVSTNSVKQNESEFAGVSSKLRAANLNIKNKDDEARTNETS